MDLTLGPDAEAFRTEVRAFLDGVLPDDWPGIGAMDRDEARDFAVTWRKTLHEGGYLGLTWPVAYGGAGRSKVDQIVLAQELVRARVPFGVLADTTSLKMMGNTLVHFGTEEQKRTHLPRIMSGEEVWVQGYSEPGSGSDLASLSLRARRDGDEWVLDGQKIWTSSATAGTHIFVLARTNPEASKNRGISFLLCPLDTPGVEVRPIMTLTGVEEFCEVFFTDVRIPVDAIIGDVDDGWTVATSLLGFERGEEAATNPIWFRAELDRIVDLARERGALDDPLVRDRLAWCHGKVEIMRFLGYRILTQYLREGRLGPEASISKLFWSEYHQEALDLAMGLLGADALVHEGRHPVRFFRTDEPGAPNNSSSWIDIFLLNGRSGTVYAGTSEIQRNILGEKILGLPREPMPTESAR